MKDESFHFSHIIRTTQDYLLSIAITARPFISVVVQTMNCSSNELERRYSSQLEELEIELQSHICEGKKNVDKFLADNSLDGKLVQYVILKDGTPRGLADFASRNEMHEILIDQLINDTDLMKEILLADGAKALSNGPAQYGPAIQIYSNILNKTECATWGGSNIFSRLALAIALEHAVPIEQNNPKAASPNEDAYVNPVNRYLSYEKAYLNGELDEAFDTLTTWELRYVVDGNEPDAIANWGRVMLRNYRPDHVFQRRYIRMVKSNIRYGSHDVKFDQDDLQQYQNILMNGGVCGRRAFFGRFVLRSFGIPTTARPSKGHGALIHWTPNGWTVALGGQWGVGWTKTLYHKDLDFLSTTKARAVEEAYWAVKKAQWIGDAMNESRVYGEHDATNSQVGFWYKESLIIQSAIVDAFHDQYAVQRPQKSSIQSTIVEQVSMKLMSLDSYKIALSMDRNIIVIPAASFQSPNRTKDVQIMPSFQGGYQIYLPAFTSQGQTILRGGTWKNDHNGCSSGARIKSGGYGKYEDWGFRVVISGLEGPGICSRKNLVIELNSRISMEFAYIKPGSFLMGGESTSDGRFQCIEVPKHPVELTKGFYLGIYPVTQAQYEAVMGNNPSKSSKNPNCPVDNIGEMEALSYCSRLVDTLGMEFRLPSEAEWEYACRADQGDAKWFFGDDPANLHEYAWYTENSGGRSHPVGQLKPNPFGLYDMYGNVYERVADTYDKGYYSNSPLVDPEGPIQGTMSMFTYSVHIQREGTYSLVAAVVTVNNSQRLKVRANDDESTDAEMELPFTNGYWQNSPHLALFLRAGENKICFWREKPPQYGIAIQTFTLEFMHKYES